MFLTRNGGRYGRYLNEDADASIDMMDPEVSKDVKDQIKELEDDLTTDVDTVDAPEQPDLPIQDISVSGDPTSVTTESCMLFEASRNHYYVAMKDILSIQEDATDEENAEKLEDDPSAEPVEPAESETQASDVVEDIAKNNGVDPEDVTVVISHKEAAFLCEMAINESKCGKKDGPARQKLNALTSAISDLKNKGIQIKKTPKKKAPKKKTKTQKKKKK